MTLPVPTDVRRELDGFPDFIAFLEADGDDWRVRLDELLQNARQEPERYQLMARRIAPIAARKSGRLPK